MEFDALRKQFYTGNAVFWMYGIWDLGTYAFPTYGLPSDEAAFFADWGWIAAPAPKKGGTPGSLTHPIIYSESAGRRVGYRKRGRNNPRHCEIT
jgi:inositol-phosphate transport system substrate-binding protein